MLVYLHIGPGLMPRNNTTLRVQHSFDSGNPDTSTDDRSQYRFTDLYTWWFTCVAGRSIDGFSSAKTCQRQDLPRQVLATEGADDEFQLLADWGMGSWSVWRIRADRSFRQRRQDSCCWTGRSCFWTGQHSCGRESRHWICRPLMKARSPLRAAWPPPQLSVSK